MAPFLSLRAAAKRTAESRTLELKPGRVNTVTIRGHGRPGARADIAIADRWA